MSYSRGLSDNMFLGLKYGSQNVKTDIFFGSDFFLQTQGVLYDMFAKAPNAIERKNILVRVAQRRNMYNKEKSKKEVILYKLMPYTSDKDFDYANDKGIVDPVNFEYQTRFSYWIGMFESEYGNIAVFYDSMTQSDSIKIITINNLIVRLINSNTNFITPTTTDGKETSS
jgi:hypothetical protein